MKDRTPAGQRTSVYALLSDLLPVLSPGSSLDQERDEVLVPLAGARARVSTATLLTACATERERRWPQVVETWLAGVDRQLADAASEGQVDPHRLRVQAVPRGDDAGAGVRAGFNSAFDLLVVEDRAGASRRLLPLDLEGLGLSAEEAVRAGLDATIGEVLVRLDVRPHTLPGGGEIRMASADGVPYVSAGITSVRQLAGADSPYGTLVGVPRHSMIVLQPVSSRSVLDGLPVLADLVGSMFDSATDRCARAVYWFVGAEAYPVGATASADGRPSLSLPPQLESVVASLPD
ncbi:hypothetical protein [uncultured Friedmanniella sp.]|uniref:hypothetical protein n=1 Tax=uncultured Friedmanniella sp. TaxID=335381 RepID=UPI0035CB3480